ncbi:hypothetical protein CIPAW_06G107900 [Carya illinoinensis]|uniref:Uncharacterized protein n=1 Tax=Carya illinoinensis TaxID=32201 RepID=A0A8T1QA85_CARIL|nr:hypothetical protein CIPAW_06G107900 [Carya illinoinensis]
MASVWEQMKMKGVKKEPGLSWIENQGIVHYFTAGDSPHPGMKLINRMLEVLNMKTRKAAYVPNHNAVPLDVEHLLSLCSERHNLGLIKIPSGRPIHIIENLQTCVTVMLD